MNSKLGSDTEQYDTPRYNAANHSNKEGAPYSLSCGKKRDRRFFGMCLRDPDGWLGVGNAPFVVSDIPFLEKIVKFIVK